MRGEHLLGDAADREHLAVEGDFALIAKPRTGRHVNADTGAATIVTPAEVPFLGRLAQADAQMHVGVAMPSRVKAVPGGGSSKSSSAAAGRDSAPDLVCRPGDTQLNSPYTLPRNHSVFARFRCLERPRYSAMPFGDWTLAVNHS